MKSGWKTEQLARPSFAPRHWGGWFRVACLWALGHLPRPVGRALVAPLGPLMARFLSSRRRIAERNIDVCLPELGPEAREALLRGTFHYLAQMLVETAWCWAGRPRDLSSLVELHGAEHIEAARASDRGTLLVTGHVTCLEMGARAIGEQIDGCGFYRPLRDPVMEWYQNRGRRRYAIGMISKRELRTAVRHLRQGGVLWFAPDQDFGAQESVFAPFFGVETATLLATHRLPRLTGCAVHVMMPRWDEDRRRYILELSPPLENFPTDDPVADLARVNALLEAGVRKAPEQYWWVHRRFKTRPPGEPDFYGRDSRYARQETTAP